jgi:hypothetical protein
MKVIITDRPTAVPHCIAILINLRSGQTRVGYALLFFYVIAAFLLRNHRTFMDEGSNLNLASCVLNGYHLYRDAFENHFPLPVYLSALIVFFTGTSLQAVRLVVLFLDVAALFAAMRISRLYFPVGFAAAMWGLISPYYFGNMLLYDNLATMGGIAMGAVCFAALARGLEPSRSMFALLAIAGFVTTMSNPFFALVTFVAIASLFFAPRIPAKFVIKLALTIAIPVVTYFIYLAVSGELTYFYSYAVVFNTTTYQKYASISVVSLIVHQLLLLDIFNANWILSWDPLRFSPVSFSPIFDYWVFTGIFYRVAALCACLFFALRRNYQTALFLYLFTAMLPLRGDALFHAAPFVLFCFFLIGILLQESRSLPRPWKIALPALLCLFMLPLTISGARYVALHALDSDFNGLLAEARLIREAAQNQNDVQLGHYPDGNYMYYLTGYRPLSKFVDFYPWVADIARSDVDADLARAPKVVLVMDLAGNIWAYPNALTLQSEVDFARKHLIREHLGGLTAWVTPSLTAHGNMGSQMDFEDVGAPLPDAPVTMTGAWRKDAFPPNTPKSPLPGAVFGTSAVGTLRLGPFPLGDGIVIPLLIGPHDQNFSLIIRDASTQKLLARMDPPPVDGKWWAWRPKLPRDPALRIEVVAEEKATASGEWSALAWPHGMQEEKRGPVFKPGLYRKGEWQLASDIEDLHGPDTRTYHFGGKPDDIPVTGDWNGSGKTRIGVYGASTGEWLLDYNGNGVADAGDKTYRFGGQPGDIPVTGDWNGDGKTKIGIYRPATGEWLLDYNGDGVFNPADDRKYHFGGDPGDRPVTGDWTGTRICRIGIVRKDYRWVLDYNGNGVMQEGMNVTFYFGGIPGDILITGDWNGNGRTKIGVFRRGYQWLFDVDGNYRFDDGRDTVFSFGSPPTDTPVTGAW